MRQIDINSFAGGAGIDRGSIKGSEKHLASLMNEILGEIKIVKEITVDATGGIKIFDSNAPCAFEVLDVIVQARVSNGSGSMKLTNGSNDITNAIACVTDKVIARAGTIDNDYSEIAKDGSLVIVANGAADRALVTIIVRKSS